MVLSLLLLEVIMNGSTQHPPRTAEERSEEATMQHEDRPNLAGRYTRATACMGHFKRPDIVFSKLLFRFGAECRSGCLVTVISDAEPGRGKHEGDRADTTKSTGKSS